jgi:hypothetical protein
MSNQLAANILGKISLFFSKTSYYMKMKLKFSIAKLESWSTKCDPHTKYKVIDRIGQGLVFAYYLLIIISDKT